MSMREAKIRLYAKTCGCPKFGEEHIRLGTDSDKFFALLAAEEHSASGVQAVAMSTAGRRSSPEATPPRPRRTGLTGRAADIRRMARSAGLPRLGEKHIRAGTSADAFFALAAQRLARRTAAPTPETPTVTKPSDFARDLARGAAEARALFKPGTGRAEPLATADDDDPEAFDEADDHDHDDDKEGHDDGDHDNVEDGKDAGDDDEVEGAGDKAKDDDRKRGAAMARGLLGRGARGVRAAATSVQAHRREARRADERRVDAALDHEAGRQEAERLLGKGQR